MKDLHIQSNQFELPQQFETLNKLCQCFKDQEFFVIGATARDMLSIALDIDLSTRTTRDLDISIAVESWDSFMKIQELLISSGFEKDNVRKQRFYYKDFELDVVPFGKLSEDGAKIYWPPEASPEMTVRGFESVLKECVNVKVDDAAIEFKIPTTAGLFVTKLDAWIDRGLEKDNDMDIGHCDGAIVPQFAVSPNQLHRRDGHHAQRAVRRVGEACASGCLERCGARGGGPLAARRHLQARPCSLEPELPRLPLTIANLYHHESRWLED